MFRLSARCTARGLASFIVLAAMAGPARAESLADAIAIAYASNPTIVGQRFQQRSIDENYVQARAQYGPTLAVQGTGSYSSERVPFQTVTGGIGHRTTTGGTGQAAAMLNQPLYTSGRLRGQLASAKAQVLGGREELRNVEQQLVENVVIVYAAVRRDEQRVEVGRQNVAVLEEQLLENRERYSRVGRGVGAGDVTLTDVGLSDSRLANAQIQLASLEAALSVSRAQYLQIVGSNPGTLDPLPPFANMPVSADDAFDAAERNNPTLLAAKYAEQSSGANAASVRGALGPTVALAAQATYSNRLSSFTGQLGTKEVVAGLTITQPLFSAGQLRSRVRQADAQNGADQAAVEAQRRATIEGVTEAWSNLAAARSGLASGERQVTSAQLAYAGMHREELDGLRSTLDTLNAEQELVSAQLTLLQNRYQEYVASAALLAAVGDLRANAFVDGFERYDPDANFRRVRNRGRTPFEPVAQVIDRLGSANPRRPVVADLRGEETVVPAAMPALPPKPTATELNRALVPVTQSRLVPAAELPGGLPPAPELPPEPPASGNNKTSGGDLGLSPTAVPGSDRQ